MKMKIKENKRKAVSLVVITFSLVTFFIMAGFSIDVGYVFNYQNELQKALESAALVGASALEPKISESSTSSISVSTPTSQSVKDIMTTTLKKITTVNPLLSKNASEITNASIEVNQISKAVRITTSITIKPFFISFVGINKINISGKAAAMAYPGYLSKLFPETSTGTGSLIYSDIRTPVGGNSNVNNNIDNIYGPPDGKGLSLGAGGMIVLRLPLPLVDDSGADLYISELGNAKGYFVLAGIDADPNNPFVSNSQPGSGIYWQNISCTGISTMPTNSQTRATGAYITAQNIGPYYISNDSKFYGSGLFDLSAKCNGSSYNANITNAQYLMIIDDDMEDGFMADNPADPVLLLGDHSSITPGVTIDAIAILHHSKLISPEDFDKDSDGDGLIDVLEEAIGTDPNSSDTDGDGVSDADEYNGHYYNSNIIFTSPNNNDKIAGNNGKIVPSIKLSN